MVLGLNSVFEPVFIPQPDSLFYQITVKYRKHFKLKFKSLFSYVCFLFCISVYIQTILSKNHILAI